jgi:ribokinase
MIGRVGDDAFGSQLRDGLRDAGVDVSTVRVSKGSSGVAVIVVSRSGENSIVVTPGANALLTPQDLDENLQSIREAGLVLAQLEIPRETVEHLTRLCVHEGVPLMLDPAPAMDLTPDILRHITWFTPNETEAAFYLTKDVNTTNSPDPGRMAELLRERGPRGVVLKMGAQGAFIASPDGDGELVPSFPVTAVDTTGAGDCFNGAFATGLMLGKTPRQSAVFASAAAAISVTRVGAQSSMPTMSEVEHFLASSSGKRSGE